MENSLHYYQVYFNSPLLNPFTYSSRIPDLVYRRVKVLLHNKVKVAFVDSTTNKLEGIKIKEILEVIDDEPIISSEQRNLAHWISRQYLSSPGEALGLFFAFKGGSKSAEKLSEGDSQIVPFEKEPSRNFQEGASMINLNSLQEKKFSSIKKLLRDFNSILVHGVTGSGKTFFYLKIAEECLRHGKQVLVLVPEINLIFHVHELCQKLFPELEIAMFHSKMEDREREGVKSQIKRGAIDMVIATRSGFFLPFKNLGVIIIDEEHENSYKNNATPRYQLKQIAFHWAKIKNIPLVFVSATPSLELFHQTQVGDMVEVEIGERYAQASLPKISFVIREEEEKISHEVYQQVFSTLEEKKQVLFYINQRGFSSIVVCGNCRYNYRCPHCEITLTFHKKRDILICHYCGYKEKFLEKCSECGEKKLQFIKAGTERFWEQLKDRFAGYHVVRFDSDSITHPQKIKNTLRDFREQKIHILVGTQMIIKGHDFKNVGLVVVIAPERYLLLPDYRSGERMFSHIMQVAGRAGREKQMGVGRVIVETNIPHHYALRSAEKQSYQEFYNQEIENRRGLNYPPFCKLIRLVFRGLNPTQVEQSAIHAKEIILNNFRNNHITILGPSPCLLEKQNRYYRWNILLKLKKQNYFLKNINKTQLIKNKKVYVEIDVSPVNLF